MVEQKQTWRQAVIRDGLTQDGYIAEVERLHPAMAFTFRPMLPEQVEEWEAHRDQHYLTKPKETRARLGKLLSQQIASWDAVDANGDAVPVSEQTCRSLRPTLQHKLYLIVACLAASEVQPDADGQQQQLPGDGLFGEPVSPLETLGK